MGGSCVLYVSFGGVGVGTGIYAHEQKGTTNQVPPPDGIAIRDWESACGLTFLSLPSPRRMAAVTGRIRARHGGDKAPYI